jgi:hypothetical protein
MVSGLRKTDTLKRLNVSNPTLTSFALGIDFTTNDDSGCDGEEDAIVTGRIMKYMGITFDHNLGIPNILAARRDIL